MKSNLISILLFTVLLCNCCKLFGQNDAVIETLVEKIEWYGSHKQSASFFVHFDKTVYTTNENVWFTGYLLNGNQDSAHQIMSVALIRNSDRTILSEGKFIIVGNYSHGNLVLPDSLPAGDYNFICFTNRRVNGFPEALFIQPVTIKSSNLSSFTASLTLVNPAPSLDSTKILVRGFTPELALLKNAVVNFSFGTLENPVLKTTTKTDKFGEASISIPNALIAATNNILVTEVNNGKEVKPFTIKLSVSHKQLVVKFYPEGGNMVGGVKSLVGWEVTTLNGEPMKVQANLYQDDIKLLGIETDEYGLGSFTFTPAIGSAYHVQLTNVPTVKYPLPNTMANGPVVHLLNSLATDTVRLRIFNLPAGTVWKMLLHNFRETFLSSSFTATGATVLLKLPLEEVPIGLHTITVVDEQGKPWAERLFFVHPQKRVTVNIATDTSSYSTREKVTMKLRLMDEKAAPIKGLVSVACVQNNRLDEKKLSNIEEYVKLQADLSSIPFKSKLLSADPQDSAFLERLLLVRGWRRYTWQDVLAVNESRKTVQKASLLLKGFVTYKGKPIKQPVNLFIRRFVSEKAPTFSLLNTDSAGRFNLGWDAIASTPYKPVYIKLNMADPYDYNVTLNDEYGMLNKSLASFLTLKGTEVRSIEEAPEVLAISAAEGARKLQDVVVVAKKENYMARGRPGRNACDDYVCLYNILNCPNHLEGFEPVVNVAYSSGLGKGQQIYRGCTQLNEEQNQTYYLQINGVFLPKKYYVTDFTITDPTDPQYVSTIYWNHSLLTDDKGEAEVTFFTSDIPGKFRIVVQGLTQDNVVYGEKMFEVRKKQ